MGISVVMQTGQSGMAASKSAISTAGHNITNAHTDGFSRQRVETKAQQPEEGAGSRARVGRGVMVDRVSRLNDEYLEKQLRNSGREMAGLEEREFLLGHVEGIFNELDGEGLNRVVSRFFNDFRQLANEPEREALRETVRESSKALVTDFRRLRSSSDDVVRMIDSRIDASVQDLNSLTRHLRDLNMKIAAYEVGSGPAANDLQDQRDIVLKKIASYVDVTTYQDEKGNVVVNLKGLGPLVVGPNAEQFSTARSKADDQGKVEGALDVMSTAHAGSNVTHVLKGGKLGALLDLRDQTMTQVTTRLDDLAFGLTKSVNEVHAKGVDRIGQPAGNYFKDLAGPKGASEKFDLDDGIKLSTDRIATAAQPDAPGDNRIALAISSLQGAKVMNGGKSTMDDFFNSIVGDVGVIRARNRETREQQGNILRNLEKMREQISGVSLDEETANLLQYQHVYDASAKVIKVADEMLKTILELRP